MHAQKGILIRILIINKMIFHHLSCTQVTTLIKYKIYITQNLDMVFKSLLYFLTKFFAGNNKILIFSSLILQTDPP